MRQTRFSSAGLAGAAVIALLSIFGARANPSAGIVAFLPNVGVVCTLLVRSFFPPLEWRDVWPTLLGGLAIGFGLEAVVLVLRGSTGHIPFTIICPVVAYFVLRRQFHRPTASPQ